jgi:pyruvate dehydrogenase E2 component (dihydrolipoamide acetyltransferase)
MPALGMNQETGRLLQWFRKEGESVTKGEALMEVETDKATVEIEAPASGVLAGVTARPGDQVPVGQPIAFILLPGEAPPAAAKAPPPRGDGGASPKARRLAAERGVDLTSVRGSGPGGAVKAVDVPAPSAPERAASGVWETMARRTTESWQQVPHFYLEREVDAGRLLSWRTAAARADEAVTITDLLVRLAAAVLPRHPHVNGGLPDAHVGVAVAVEDGLVVPVIRDAGRLSLAQITVARRQLVERARAGKLRPEDMQGGTFTISNLGMHAVDAFTAIVNQPQAAILAVGRIAERVVAVGGAPSVRPALRLTVSFDHRQVDGARGAAFLTDLGDLIEEPAALL